jgi:hypothetical protein
MKMKTALITAFLVSAFLALLPLPAAAQSDPSAVIDALTPGTGLEQVQRLAEQGNAEAQNRLGWMYSYGKGLPKDYKQGLFWFQKAADQGLAKSQYNLSATYQRSIGVPRDYAKALYWYRKAADQGDADAQYSVGFMYATAEGVERDLNQAYQWFSKSAQQGNAKAQYALGGMYDQGAGVAQDYKQAVAWYRKAANQGYAQAQTNLGAKYNNGQGVTQSYAQAREWYLKAARQGEPTHRHRNARPEPTLRVRCCRTPANHDRQPPPARGAMLEHRPCGQPAAGQNRKRPATTTRLGRAGTPRLAAARIQPAGNSISCPTVTRLCHAMERQPHRL